MDPATQWQILTLAVMTGGHVRVGWEDNPYGAGGAGEEQRELVDKIVRTRATGPGSRIAGRGAEDQWSPVK
jgi:uncharacterized protein (DUF849 family)